MLRKMLASQQAVRSILSSRVASMNRCSRHGEGPRGPRRCGSGRTGRPGAWCAAVLRDGSALPPGRLQGHLLGNEARPECDQNGGDAVPALETRQRRASHLSPYSCSGNSAFMPSCPSSRQSLGKVSRRGLGGLDLDQCLRPGSRLCAIPVPNLVPRAYSGPDPLTSALTPIQARIASPTNGNSTT